MLEKIDLKKTLAKTAYAKQITALQERLRKLQYAARDAEVPVVVCLEGWDSAGKGLVIKKLTEKLDPRLFRVHPGSAPSALEQRYHFLWRYQVALPNDGEMAVFDHSWYGRVLVERCDKLTPRKQWRDAYEQINQFERLLADDGQVLIKVWLHISKKEQKKRFRAALADPLLKWKITKEYRRHHRDYARWVEAVEEMLARTDTAHAPWSVIEANDTRYSRVRFFEVLAERMEDALAKRKRAPEAVSRTAAAAVATTDARSKKAKKDAELAKQEEQKTMARGAKGPQSVPAKAEVAHA